MKCILCGRTGKSLDEHIESHHNNYDVHRVLEAVVESLKQLNGGSIPKPYLMAQAKNYKRIQSRARSMLRK